MESFGKYLFSNQNYMSRTLILLLITFKTTVSIAQLPDCVRKKCDSILQEELGKKIYKKCVDYVDFECTKNLDILTDNPCDAHSRHSYLVRYKFTFPKQKGWN